MSATSERGVQPHGEPGLDPLVVRACVAALWADGAMTAAERDHLSHLIDDVEGDEAERESLRRQALHGVDLHEVLGHVLQLEPTARLDLFDRCRAIITSDRRVRRGEARFLGELARACGIGFWRRERLLWGLTPGRRIGLLAAGALLVLLAFLPRVLHEVTVVPPAELVSHRELFLAPPVEATPLEASELFERVRRSVVTVNVTEDGTLAVIGSGAVIGADAAGQLYVLTNRHVVYQELAADRSLTFDVAIESGVRLPALLDFYSRRSDLALLVVPGLTGWARPLPLARRADLRVGQRVYAVGSPLGLDHTFTEGVISAVRGEYLQTDATVSSGSSGGPLLDEMGRLCGVVTATHPNKDLSFALYADTVGEMLVERSSTTG